MLFRNSKYLTLPLHYFVCTNFQLQFLHFGYSLSKFFIAWELHKRKFLIKFYQPITSSLYNCGMQIKIFLYLFWTPHLLKHGATRGPIQTFDYAPMAKPPLLSLPENNLSSITTINNPLTICATPQHRYRRFVFKELNFCQHRQKN